MQLPEPIETQGYFWHSAEPINRLPGKLTISKQGDVTLEIFGSFDPTSVRFDRQLLGQKLQLQGVTEKTGAVSLIDCIIVEQNDVQNIELLSKSRLHVGCALSGAHLDIKEPYFSSMTFSVEGLDEWFAFYHHPFSSDLAVADLMSLTYQQPESITFHMPHDLTISFHMGVGFSSGMFQQSMTTKMGISIGSHRSRTFSEFMHVLLMVRNFLCLAFDRTVSFTSITGSWQEPTSANKTVGIYGHFEPYDLPRQDISIGHFLISFDEVADRIQHYLATWLERYEEYEPTFNLYFTVTANRYMHVEGGFLFLVHSIESLHRRIYGETGMAIDEFDSVLKTILSSTPDPLKEWVEDSLRYSTAPNLRQRIKQLLDPFKDLFGTKSDRRTFLHQVVSTRNYLTHYDESKKGQAVTDPDDLIKLRSKLEALIQLYLLQLLGFEMGHIKKIASRYPSLQEKLGVS